jgi:fructose-1,6-bisphosphatase/inositol monophosphatase family enzyme
MPTDTNELRQLLDFAVDIAREAGAITWRHYQGSFVAERKADNSFVTIANREAEAHLRARITEACPDDSILGEEEGEQSGSSNRRWILDPMDGTYSFVHGVPLYGVIDIIKIFPDEWKICLAYFLGTSKPLSNVHLHNTSD